MEKSVEMHRTKEVGVIPLEAIASSSNARVKKVLKRLEDKSFLERICSYSEKYWDDHHSQTW